MNEFEIIKKYFQKISRNKSSLYLNDDVFFDKKKELIISVDTYVKGQHFVDFKKPDLVIKKVIRSSISDLICKGVKPKYYFISGSGDNKSFSKKNLLKIKKSLTDEQKNYRIFLSGGDTVFSNKLSFTVVSVGFSKKIIYRNQAKVNDNIYVTGNLGDSYLGLLLIKKKIKLNKFLSNYFIKKYYMPDIQVKLINLIRNYANSSIDISDGLLADLEKLINVQNISYKLYLKDIPVSNNLRKILSFKKLSKINLVSKGDDYQILFTASNNKRKIINKISKKLGIKITIIGKIQKGNMQSSIVDPKNMIISLKNKGYFHNFK